MPGVAYHVTQRGVNRGNVFVSHRDRDTYLELLAGQLEPAGVRVLGWCLMTNHVHWVVVPEREDSLSVLFRRVHGRYAQYFNVVRGRNGHLWQNRYFACPVGPEREEQVLRYVEWNPVRAGMVSEAADYKWSSARAHLEGEGAERIRVLDWAYWREMGGASEWRRRLEVVEDVRVVQEIRKATFAGAPWGEKAFVQRMEEAFGRHWGEVGRPRGKGAGKGDGAD